MNDVLDDLRAAADYQIRMSGSASDYLLEAENEIKRLRAEVERMRSEKTVRIDRFIRRRMAEAWEDGWFDRDCQEFDWHQNPYKGRRNKP